MAGLPYEERIRLHHATKPFSIDPFNEVGIPTKERDALLAKDFLASYESLNQSIIKGVTTRYHNMGREFG